MSSPANVSRVVPRWSATAIAIVLLGVFGALCLYTAHESSITFDEPEQIAIGYASLTIPGHGYSIINLRLSQIWEALPLLAFDPAPRFPSWIRQEPFGAQNISYGRLFFFKGGRDAQEMLFACRSMVVILGVVLGWAIFSYSRRLHGSLAGLLSLSLYVFCPLVIAHSSVASTDIATALLFFLSTLGLWRLLDRPGAINTVLAGLAVGALVATKISGLLIAPIAVLLVGAKAFERHRDRATPSVSPAPSWPRVATALLGAACVAWAALWLVYGGVSAAPPEDPAPWPTNPVVSAGLPIKLVEFARDWRLLPDAFLFDLHQFAHSSVIRRSYLFGEYSVVGWWYFFPVAALVKNPLPFLAALLAASVATWRLWRARSEKDAVDLRGLAPLFILAAVYAAFAIAGNLNIGARHLLPLFPPALVFAGLAPRLLRPDRRERATLACLLAGGAGLETAFAHPYYMGYFNALAGGSNQGRHVMVDSSTDWGESLPQVRRWIERRNTGLSEAEIAASRVYLSSFANTDYDYYGLGGPGVVLLPQYYDDRPVKSYPLGPGSYVISATMLACVYNGRFMGPWRPAYEKLYQERLGQMADLQSRLHSKEEIERLFSRDGAGVWMSRIKDFDYLRFSRLCAYLRHRGPDAQITPGVLVFELTLHDLETALAGPPPELAPDGAIKGADRFADEELDFIK